MLLNCLIFFLFQLFVNPVWAQTSMHCLGRGYALRFEDKNIFLAHNFHFSEETLMSAVLYPLSFQWIFSSSAVNSNTKTRQMRLLLFILLTAQNPKLQYLNTSHRHLFLNGISVILQVLKSEKKLDGKNAQKNRIRGLSFVCHVSSCWNKGGV